jgi:hypothetical protein
MKIGRVAEAFPWRTGLILIAALCLSALASWVWFSWELPPLQRYYLRAYWDSSRTADDPQAVTEVRWLDLTAPGHKDGWPLDADVDDDPFDSSQVALSYQARSKGWIGIKISPPNAERSVEVEDLLRRGIYHGRYLRQLLGEPASYACCAVFLALFIAWRIRDGIATEWSDLWRAVWEPESVKESGWDITPYRPAIRARIRNRIAGSLATPNGIRKSLLFARLAPRPSVPDSSVDPESGPAHSSPSLSANDPVPRISNPGASVQTNPDRNVHLVFPGSSPSNVPSKDTDAWHESEWIE